MSFINIKIEPPIAGEYCSTVDLSFADPDGTVEVEDATEIIVGGPENADGNVTSPIGDGAMDGKYKLDLVGTGTGQYTINVTSVEGNTIKGRYFFCPKRGRHRQCL
jgi:hypothetical protein